MGETHLGAYAEKARVKGDWLVKLPDSISTRDAMAIGTAGYTAMLSVMALEDHGLKPASGPMVVTGAAGGVGSVATAILSQARLSRHRLDRPRVGGRLPEASRRRRDHRPRRTCRRAAPAQQGALGRRRRQRRLDHAREPAVDDEIRRRDRRLRPRRGHGFACLGCAIHFARGVPFGHQLGDVPDRAPPHRLGAAGARPRQVKTR